MGGMSHRESRQSNVSYANINLLPHFHQILVLNSGLGCVFFINDCITFGYVFMLCLIA